MVCFIWIRYRFNIDQILQVVREKKTCENWNDNELIYIHFSFQSNHRFCQLKTLFFVQPRKHFFPLLPLELTGNLPYIFNCKYSTLSHTHTSTQRKWLFLVYSNRKQFSELTHKYQNKTATTTTTKSNTNRTKYLNHWIHVKKKLFFFLYFLFLCINVFISQFSARKLKGHQIPTHI